MVSEEGKNFLFEMATGGLNPCFSGGWSRRVGSCGQYIHRVCVLILVLVEDGLGGLGQLAGCEKIFTVLILVLVEDGLGAR